MGLDPSKSDVIPVESGSLSTVIYSRKYIDRHQQELIFENVEPGRRILRAGDLVRGRVQDGAFYGNFLASGKFAAVCDVGFFEQSDRKSPHEIRNEDGILKLEVGDKRYLAVADGMGGHPASDLACRAFLKNLAVHLMNGDVPRLASLRAARNLERVRQRNSEYRGEETSEMGLCFVLAEFNEREEGTYVRFYHSGDCRAFLMQGSNIWQTADHSAAQTLLRKKLITTDHPEFAALNNTVMYSIGLSGGRFQETKFTLEASQDYLLGSSDAVILASDGLWDNISPEVAKDAVTRAFMDEEFVLSEDIPVPQSIVKTLYDHLAAKSRLGGRDFKKDNLAIAAITL